MRVAADRQLDRRSDYGAPDRAPAVRRADGAALYLALALQVTYRQVGTAEQVRLRTSLRAVGLERVGGGDFPTYDTRHDLGSGCLTDPFRSVLTSSQTDAKASSASI
jgi:hypothetical protein